MSFDCTRMCPHCKSERIESTVVDLSPARKFRIYTCDDCKRVTARRDATEVQPIEVYQSPDGKALILCPCYGLHDRFVLELNKQRLAWEVTCNRCQREEVLAWDAGFTQL